jgi:c-di-GMP-binding flagellar brake protein YcgR
MARIFTRHNHERRKKRFQRRNNNRIDSILWLSLKAVNDGPDVPSVENLKLHQLMVVDLDHVIILIGPDV